ncbi:MAG TPA: protein kinase [Chloroflexota bacterium]
MAGSDKTLGNSRYRALVLGPFELERDGVTLDAGHWQRRVQTLFKLLITAPGRQRRRDDLIELLWPETDPDAASGNLRILAHRLRLTLGGEPSPVLSSNGWITLNPAYQWDLDLEELEALVKESHGSAQGLEKAIAMVRGEPLVENRYDDWAAPLAAHAMRMWRDACLQLAAIYRTSGRQDETIIWYERLLAADPLDEEALRGLISAIAWSGKPAEALRRYESFRTLLSEEMDVEPAAETDVLVEKIRAHLDVKEGEAPLPTGGFLGAVPEGPLIGRADELERALLSSDAVQIGAGRLVLISGEVGVGKTRLAQEVMLRLRERAFLIVTARCYARDQAVPFAPFLDLLAQIYGSVSPVLQREARERWPYLTLLLPQTEASGMDQAAEGPDEQHTLFRNCAEFLGRLSRERPVALLLDDLHWADDASLDLLCYLARETRSRPTFLLAAYRDGDISRDHPLAGAIRDMAREGLVERLALGRLGPEETATMVASLLGNERAPADFSEFVFRRTRGNPLFVRKMLHALGGRYRLTRQIGAGGMGRIFEAFDDRTGERLAVKLMFARTEADPKALLRFQQEGAVLATLHHPNIVQVRGTFVEEYASCIAMELLEGRSLADVLRDGPLPLDRAKNMAAQILAALAAAHERGVVHRDVKPANVMVLGGDRVKVTDFGVARLARPPGDTSLTATGMTLGTALYMAPEQVQDGKVDGRTDLYALGAVLYHMVTGRPPFEAAESFAVALMQVNDIPVPPRAVRPGISEEWDAVILRALAKSPGDRFQSAVAMQRALSALPTLEDEKAAQRPRPVGGSVPLGPPSRAKSRMAMRRRIPAFLGMAAVALAGVFLLGTRYLSSNGGVSGVINGPAAVATDARGDVYVSDEGNNRIVELNATGKPIHSWGTTGQGLLQFSSPEGLEVAGDGTLYIADVGNKRIQVLRQGRVVNENNWPTGSLALDPAGRYLFASDFGHNQVWELKPSLDRVYTLQLHGIFVGAHPFPAGMATDKQGNLYIADREHNRIVKLSPTGKQLASFGGYGTGQPAYGGEPKFSLPSGVSVDGQGNIYVADTDNNRIEILNSRGRVIRIVTGESAHQARLDQPASVTVDRQGDIIVADYFDNQVVKMSPQGTVLWTSPKS